MRSPSWSAISSARCITGALPGACSSAAALWTPLDSSVGEETATLVVLVTGASCSRSALSWLWRCDRLVAIADPFGNEIGCPLLNQPRHQRFADPPRWLPERHVGPRQQGSGR